MKTPNHLIALVLVPCLVVNPSTASVARDLCPVPRNCVLDSMSHGSRTTGHDYFSSQALSLKAESSTVLGANAAENVAHQVKQAVPLPASESEIESTTAKKEVIDLTALVRRQLEVWQPWNLHHVMVFTDFPKEPLLVENRDSSDLSLEWNLVGALIVNAYKYTLEGSIHLQLRREGDEALFIIQDTGIGIENKDLPRIWHDFFRAGNARTTAGGNGRGLPLTKAIVEKYNGNLDVKSELGKGTQFTVRLPLLLSPAAAPEPRFTLNKRVVAKADFISSWGKVSWKRFLVI